MVNGKWLKGFLFYFSTIFSFPCGLDLCATKRKHIEILRQTNWNWMTGMDGGRQAELFGHALCPLCLDTLRLQTRSILIAHIPRGAPKAYTYSGLFFFCWESLLALSKCVKGCHDDKNVLAAIYLCRFRFAWFRFIRFYLGKRLAELSHVPCVRPFDMRFGHAPFAGGKQQRGRNKRERERVRDWVGVSRELSCAKIVTDICGNKAYRIHFKSNQFAGQANSFYFYSVVYQQLSVLAVFPAWKPLLTIRIARATAGC